MGWEGLIWAGLWAKHGWQRRRGLQRYRPVPWMGREKEGGGKGSRTLLQSPCNKAWYFN